MFCKTIEEEKINSLKKKMAHADQQPVSGNVVVLPPLLRLSPSCHPSTGLGAHTRKGASLPPPHELHSKGRELHEQGNAYVNHPTHSCDEPKLLVQHQRQTQKGRLFNAGQKHCSQFRNDPHTFARKLPVSVFSKSPSVTPSNQVVVEQPRDPLELIIAHHSSQQAVMDRLDVSNELINVLHDERHCRTENIRETQKHSEVLTNFIAHLRSQLENEKQRNEQLKLQLDKSLVSEDDAERALRRQVGRNKERLKAARVTYDALVARYEEKEKNLLKQRSITLSIAQPSLEKILLESEKEDSSKTVGTATMNAKSPEEWLTLLRSQAREIRKLGDILGETTTLDEDSGTSGGGTLMLGPQTLNTSSSTSQPNVLPHERPRSPQKYLLDTTKLELAQWNDARLRAELDGTNGDDAVHFSVTDLLSSTKNIKRKQRLAQTLLAMSPLQEDKYFGLRDAESILHDQAVAEAEVKAMSQQTDTLEEKLLHAEASYQRKKSRLRQIEDKRRETYLRYGTQSK